MILLIYQEWIRVISRCYSSFWSDWSNASIEHWKSFKWLIFQQSTIFQQFFNNISVVDKSHKPMCSSFWLDWLSASIEHWTSFKLLIFQQHDFLLISLEWCIFVVVRTLDIQPFWIKRWQLFTWVNKVSIRFGRSMAVLNSKSVFIREILIETSCFNNILTLFEIFSIAQIWTGIKTVPFQLKFPWTSWKKNNFCFQDTCSAVVLRHQNYPEQDQSRFSFKYYLCHVIKITQNKICGSFGEATCITRNTTSGPECLFSLVSNFSFFTHVWIVWKKY